LKTQCGVNEIVPGKRVPRVLEWHMKAIMGHAEKRAAGVYGEVPLEEAREAINALRDPLRP
jgi:hypothetical protein